MITDNKDARKEIETIKSNILSIEADEELLLIALRESEAAIMRRLKFKGDVNVERKSG